MGIGKRRKLAFLSIKITLTQTLLWFLFGSIGNILVIIVVDTRTSKVE